MWPQPSWALDQKWNVRALPGLGALTRSSLRHGGWKRSGYLPKGEEHPGTRRLLLPLTASRHYVFTMWESWSGRRNEWSALRQASGFGKRAGITWKNTG